MEPKQTIQSSFIIILPLNNICRIWLLFDGTKNVKKEEAICNFLIFWIKFLKMNKTKLSMDIIYFIFDDKLSAVGRISVGIWKNPLTKYQPNNNGYCPWLKTWNVNDNKDQEEETNDYQNKRVIH